MKPQHLSSAILAVCLFAGMLSGGLAYAQGQESLYIHVMATHVTQQMTIGEAWQRAAFKQPDLLVIYGSSELLDQPGPYQAIRFFHTYPTGFDTVEIARGGINSLNLAQDLAAVGSYMQGTKVVISFTPTMFITPMTGEAAYDGNFSQIHADEFIFSTLLSWGLKQAAAGRMLQYPKTLVNDPILNFALKQLVANTPLAHVLYDLDFPLGRMEILIERLQDHWAVINYISSNPRLNPVVPVKPATVDWSKMVVTAEQQYRRESNNNPYGIENKIWTANLSRIVARGGKKNSEYAFLKDMQTTQEWVDLEILLRTLKELGAQPLVMSRPFNGAFWDTQGITAQDRSVYYDKLANLVQSFQFPLVEFRNHDEDRYFNIDSASHTSPKGWIYVDQALDAFYNGTYN